MKIPSQTKPAIWGAVGGAVGGFEEPVFEVEPGGIPGFLGGLSGGTAGLLALHGRWRRQPLPGDAPYAGATFASHARRRML